MLKEFKKEAKKHVYNRRDEIINHYSQHYSVSKVMRDFGLSEGARRWIEKILKEEDIYQGTGGLQALKKVERIESTMMKRYGVRNAGQLDHGGWKLLNGREKTDPEFISDFNVFKGDVERLTKKNRKKMIPSKYCYYTGIKFVDEEVDNPNPNDQRKRTIDHKISVWDAYFVHNFAAEDVSNTSNLVYCIRYANSIKHNKSHHDFKKTANIIRKRFIDEGFASN